MLVFFLINLQTTYTIKMAKKNDNKSPGGVKKEIERRIIDLSDHSRIPRNITDVILTSKQNGLSVNSIRIILIILARVKPEQIYDNFQLSLFDSSFSDITMVTESSVQFNMLWKDLLPEGSRNYAKAYEGLRELRKYDAIHTFKNEKGEDIIVDSSIVSDIIINKNQKGVKFNMGILWYRLFLALTPYNKFPNEIIFSVSSMNALVWYFYLRTLPKNQDGYTLTMANINEKFHTSYKIWSKIKEKILDPIREILDNTADISFNYKIDGDKLRIVIYHNEKSVPLTFKDDDALKTARTIKYQKKKYQLDSKALSYLEVLYKTYTYIRVHHAISRQPSLNKLIGKEYVDQCWKLVHAYEAQNPK